MLALLLWLSLDVSAHRMRPAIVDVEFTTEGRFHVNLELNLEAMLAGIGPQHRDTEDSPQAARYNELRQWSASDLEVLLREQWPRLLKGLGLYLDDEAVAMRLQSVAIDAVGDVELPRSSRLQLEGKVRSGSQAAVWHYAAEYGNCVIRFQQPGMDKAASFWLSGGQPSPAFPLDAVVVPRDFWVETGRFIELGYLHIVPVGLDHMLFVLGLFFLSLKWRPLLSQVTAFTVAHTITLGLSMYGLISLPAQIVEPLIALSIAYVGVENLLTRELKPWRIMVVFAFGLLHGIGFAEALTSMQLERADYLHALISFNIGVELGQLSVLLMAFVAFAMWFGRERWYRRAIAIPGSLLIALTGLLWTLQRL